MKKMHILFALAVVALLPRCTCGDHANSPDAAKKDSMGSNGFPAVPMLGAQIDRLGRPAINTALNHAFDANGSNKGAAKDAYNQDTAIASWQTTYGAQFAGNLAIIDAVDDGLFCQNGACMGSAGWQGCGTQVLYNGSLSGGGSAGSASYSALASLVADDELYVDTAQPTCGLYLGVEIGAQITGTSVTCGGRAPSYDVMGATYTAVGIGLGGVKQTDGSFAQFINSAVTNVPVHADVSDLAFPFLGTPH